MSKFIELHDIELGNKPILINTDHIIAVGEDSYDVVSVYCGRQTFEVEESYEDVVRKIRECKP